MSEQKQVVAPQKSIRDVILSDVMKKQFQNALPKVLPVDRFIRCLVTQFSRIPQLADCDKASVLSAAMTAAQLGLEIDPALGRAYLLPYRDKKRGMIAQLIIGYKGFIDLAYRSGQVSGVQAEVVYEKDTFNYKYGLTPELSHIPSESEERGNLKYAWVVVSLKNGGQVWRVLNRAEIMRHKAFSKGADSEYSPWNTAEAEMWRKTSIRSIAPLLPLSPELRDAVAVEEADAPVVQLVDAVDITETFPQSGSEGLAAAASTAPEVESVSKNFIKEYLKKGDKAITAIVDTYLRDTAGKALEDCSEIECKQLLSMITKSKIEKAGK